MKKTITYILSTNYAGSTMLALMLGAHSRVLQIGEAKRLRRVKHKQLPCALCGHGNICSLFDGITPDKTPQLYDIIFSRADVDVIVDHSKKPFWAKQFLEQRDKYDIKFIHLVRDPRSLVRRWDMKFEGKSKTAQRWKLIRKSTDMLFRAPFCNATEIYMYKWLYQNREISEFLSKYQLDSCILTYRDLVLDTEEQLKRINDFIGIDYEPQEATYWTTLQHGGGKISDILQHEGIQLDTRWQDYLPDDMKSAVLGNKLVNQYLEENDISFTDDGLHFNNS